MPKTKTRPSAVLPKEAEGAELITLAQAANFFKIPDAAMIELAETNGFPGVKILGVWRFRLADLINWMNISVNSRLTEVAANE